MVDNHKLEKSTRRARLPSSLERIESQLNVDPRDQARMAEAWSLAIELKDPDTRRRANVRKQLVSLGRPAIPALLSALQNPSDDVRWQAAKALRKLHDLETAGDLVNAFYDDNFGVRWLAAEGLIAMGPGCVETLLKGLILGFGSMRLREGVHHVLHALVDGGLHDESLVKLMHALEGITVQEGVAWAAEKALEEMQKKH